MPICAVAACENFYGNSKTNQSNVISYYCFPKDDILRKEWIINCKLVDRINPHTARICSEHFRESDFERDLQSELLGLKPKKKLKNGAVPRLKLEVERCFPVINETHHGNSSATGKDHEQHQPFAERSPCETISRSPVSKRKLDLVYPEDNDNSGKSSSKKRKQDGPLPCTHISKNNSQCRTNGISVSSLSIQVQKLQKELAKRKLNDQKLKAKVSDLRKKLKEKTKELAEEQKQKRRNVKKEIEEEVKKIVGTVFTKSQIRCLMNKKRSTKWDAEDICRALTLRAISRKAFIYIRTKARIPSPGLSTLQAWTRNFKCRSGIILNVLDLMKTKAVTLTDSQRLTVLSFDEMNVDGRMCYDPDEDRILGPHSNVQVAMARGLIGKWKQPVFYKFDQQMTGELMTEIICKLEEIEYQVFATVSDLGRKNVRVLRELGVTTEQPCFQNFVDADRKVWVFADIPHVLKLLRGHILDHGIELPSGHLINKKFLEELISRDNGEIKICPKLNESHLTVSGRDRQNVRKAAQLLSRHTAKLIEFLFPKEVEKANFFELVNDAFDVFNSYVKNDERKKLASGLGMYLDEQMKVLDKFYEVCNKMRVAGRKTLLPFQSGFLQSINALKGLYGFVGTRSVGYLLTHRLNQDCLENFFSQVRGLGHFYDQPLPMEVKNRIRLLLMGANSDSIPLSRSVTVSASETGDTEFISSQLFKRVLPADETENEIASLDVDEEQHQIAVGADEEQDLPAEETENEIASLDIDEEQYQIAVAADTEQVLTEQSSSTDSSLDKTVPDCPAEGFRYLAGYIAFKMRGLDRSLGDPTGNLMQPNRDMVAAFGWIEILSRGGLLVPSSSWMETVKEFEDNFLAFHGSTSLSKEAGVIRNLCATLQQKFSHMHKKCIKLFVRTRTFIRLRYLNQQAKAAQSARAAARKAKKWKASDVSGHAAAKS